MFQYDRAIADIRLTLQEPDNYAPSDDFLMQKLADVCQLLHIQANNTGTGWSNRSMEITLGANETEYTIAAGQTYGKPVRLHTYDPTNARVQTCKIELVDRREMEAFRGVDAAIYYFDAETWQPKLEFLQPWPETRYLRLWWESGEIKTPNLGDRLPVNGPFHRYAVIKAAVASIGACEWSALANGLAPADAEKAFEMRRRALESRLEKQEIEFAQAFDSWIWNNREVGTGHIPGYADDFEQASQNDELWIFSGGRW